MVYSSKMDWFLRTLCLFIQPISVQIPIEIDQSILKGYDEQSRQEVEKLLKSADDLLYGEISTTDNQLLFKECQDWMNTFPHIRYV
ncbi:hypothetical protein BKA69DRAFT_1082772 [Paraphysoderma sedebokerense]|nr:hypothetical protein BKA69DRAFT_1082718 [Paraphysoderma sedebokerense]KAI9139971.1 hypothetical protein BKA69DRAFT_1082772 [Paraphysoderma sedebokerense]